MAIRTDDLAGRVALLIWLAMLALAIGAWTMIPSWPPPAHLRGSPLPPLPDGCHFVIVQWISRIDCGGLPAGALIGWVLTYAVWWVAIIPLAPLLLLQPWLLVSPPVLLVLLPSAVTLGLAVRFVRRRVKARLRPVSHDRSSAPGSSGPG